MIDTKALRSRVLDLAIQGKLTEQLESDGTAEALYQQIQAEKQRLIKEGKLKKEKPLPEISEDEIPFEIPENWKWVRWGNLSESIQYGYNAPAKESGRIRMVRITDIQNNSVQWQNVPFCDIEETAINDYLLQNGDILFARTGGTVGKSFIVTNISEESVYAGYLIRTRYSSNLSGAYLKFFMESKLYWKQLQVGTTATAQPNCNGKTLSKMILPLPPLAEQKRIVARVEEIFRLLDIIDAAQEQYAADAESLKAKLITLGIQGRLTEQLASDGTAEELYQQIQAEKQRLIKEGKIKREKPLPEISDDEIPFEIPENWKWVRLRDLVSILGDGIHGTPKYDETGEYYFINGNNLCNGQIVIKPNTKRINQEEYNKHKKELNNTTILISINGTLGNIAFYNSEKVILGKSACYMNLILEEMKADLFYLFKTEYFLKYAHFTATGVTIKNVSLKAMNELPIPLPPLAEQKRIAETLERVLGVL